MLNRLNVRSLSTEYKKSFFVDGKLKVSDKFLFFIFPHIFALILCLVKLPDNDLKNLLGTSLSIFIGLFLNVVAILISQINTTKSNINFTEQNLRLDILQETLYNILYALLQSVKALIILYLMSILILGKTGFGDFYCIILERDIDLDIQFVLSFFLFKFNTSLILSFYIMIKNIVTLFQKEINIEKLNIRNNQAETEE
ncbi:hypothetical protein C3B47_13480 [Flavobacterium columnare]|uniref:hypothetical protein n=1 Tax=Flavobacterium columnare TaxID=996 RepID=UPI0018966B1D|nr:hypothetical protein [Flavobacterium columnare]MBF6653874.1 hypothetical protein [Flavobacterium columnare]MBF6656960.1 hypothetical protein [Flavobacterium columnare]